MGVVIITDMVVSIATIPSHCRLVLAKKISRVERLIQNQWSDQETPRLKSHSNFAPNPGLG